jgi:hypothetical protein
MVNAWSLLYDEMNKEDHDKSYYEYDRNDPNRKNPFVDGHGDVHYPADHPSQDFWHEDGFSLTGNPGAAAPDTITFSSDGYAAAQPVPLSTYTEDIVTFNLNSDIEEIRKAGGYEYTPLTNDTKYIYESPDKGKTVYRRKFGQTERELINIDEGVDRSIQDNMPPWGHSDMEALGNYKIDLNLDATSKNGFWKYSEDLTLKEIRDYLSGTYKSHYTSQESKTQTLDLVESIGDAEPFCRSNAIKYLSRFGKKGGKSKLDILKAIHYCILLYHFAGLHNANSNSYETF